MNESFGRVIDEFIEEKEYEDEQKKLKELIQSLRVGVAIANIDISASLHQGIFLPSSPKEGPPAKIIDKEIMAWSSLPRINMWPLLSQILCA